MGARGRARGPGGRVRGREPRERPRAARRRRRGAHRRRPEGIRPRHAEGEGHRHLQGQLREDVRVRAGDSGNGCHRGLRRSALRGRSGGAARGAHEAAGRIPKPFILRDADRRDHARHRHEGAVRRRRRTRIEAGPRRGRLEDGEARRGFRLGRVRRSPARRPRERADLRVPGRPSGRAPTRRPVSVLGDREAGEGRGDRRHDLVRCRQGGRRGQALREGRKRRGRRGRPGARGPRCGNVGLAGRARPPRRRARSPARLVRRG